MGAVSGKTLKKSKEKKHKQSLFLAYLKVFNIKLIRTKWVNFTTSCIYLQVYWQVKNNGYLNQIRNYIITLTVTEFHLKVLQDNI